MIANNVKSDFAAALSPVTFVRTLGFSDLGPWQADLLNSQDKRILLLAARQAASRQYARSLHFTTH
jgi:hypothetical protein